MKTDKHGKQLRDCTLPCDNITISKKTARRKEHYNIIKPRQGVSVFTPVEIPEHIFSAMLILNNVQTHEQFCSTLMMHTIINDMLQPLRQIALEVYSS